VIVGVGVVAMLQLLAAGTVVNKDGSELTTGLNLVKNVREFSMHLHYKTPSAASYPYHWGLESGESASTPPGWDDIDDMAGRTFDPPIDGGGVPMPGYAGWKQVVTCTTVDPDNPTATTGAGLNGAAPGLRVSVTVLRNERPVITEVWYAFDGAPW
jgi:hypothetical protein